MTLRAKTPRHSNHHTKTANKPSLPFGRWLAPAALAMLVLAVILTAGLQAPTATQAHELDNHKHGCASPPAESCPQYDDDPIPGELTIWSTTMTVGIGGFTTPSITQETSGYSTNIGGLDSTEFTYSGTTYTVTQLNIDKTTVSSIATNDTVSLVLDAGLPSKAAQKLALELDGTRFPLTDAVKGSNNYVWSDHGLTWAENESIAVKIIELPTPNAYGYRTIWNALITAEVNTAGTLTGYNSTDLGEITNDLMVDTRTDRGLIINEFRYPWTGYKMEAIYASGPP